MDHLQEAMKNVKIADAYVSSDECSRAIADAGIASAHALIDIAESLHRLIECQVVNVPIVGTIGDGGKVTMAGGGE